jgi:hypothetical protein
MAWYGYSQRSALRHCAVIPIDISNGPHRRLELTVTLISYGLRAAIIHSSIRVRPIHCSYPQAQACLRQGTAYTYTTEPSPFPCACSRNAVSGASDTLVVQSTGRKSCIKGHSKDNPTCYFCWKQVQNKSCLFHVSSSNCFARARQAGLEVRRAWSRLWNGPNPCSYRQHLAGSQVEA